MTDSEQSEHVPFWQACAYGLGGLAGGIIGYGFGALYPVFNLRLAVSPSLLGLSQSLPRFVDVFTDPLAGYLSDSLRRKLSRRVFVAAGAIFGGVCAAGIWLFPGGLSELGYFGWILLFACLAMVGWSFLSVPWQALGFEMTGDANQRTKLMAYSNFMNAAFGLVNNWVYVIAQSRLFSSTVQGVHWVGGALGVVIIGMGLTCAFVCRDRPKSAELRAAPADLARTPTFKDFLAATKRVVRNRPFMLLTLAVMFMLLGLFGAGMCGTYVYIYFIERGIQAKGMVLFAYGLTCLQLASLVATAPIAWVAARIGKVKTLLLFLGIAFAGNAAKWICFNPAWPWLIAVPLSSCGLGLSALWVLTPSMLADVSDADEAESGNQDAGMFSAFYIWTGKLATSLAVTIGGFMLSLTGFDVARGAAQGFWVIMRMRLVDFGFPAISTVIAMVLIARYPITPERMSKVQEVLRLRRAGAAGNGSRAEGQAT